MLGFAPEIRAVNLRIRFLLIAALVVIVASLASWLVFQRIAEGIIEQWGVRLAEIQVRYDSVRMLQPLEREIALARQMADSTVLRRWAANPDDVEMKALALEEMESFRRNFRDGNYFVALLDSGAYYHNNHLNAYADQPLRYHLSPDNPDDAWFYMLVEQEREFHLNVNPDQELGVTKLWVDMLLRDGDRILGIVGTGLDLQGFLEQVVDPGQPGINSLFVDHSGAIQLHRDAAIIDYASIVKPEGQKNTLQGLLDRDSDRQRITAMMNTLRQQSTLGGKVLSEFVMMEGRRYLAGIVYIPAVDWYEVTLLDLAELMPVNTFMPVAVAFTLSLLLSLLLMQLALRRYVLKPVQSLEQAMIDLEERGGTTLELPRDGGEMGRLANHFKSMSAAIASHTTELEDRVRERTAALHQLARVDSLTGLLNRRGMMEVLGDELERSAVEGSGFGVLLCDLDYFKALNDASGHAAGDQALCEVAHILTEVIRVEDGAARWGGDEFLVLLSPCDAATLQAIGERIRQRIEQAMADTNRAVTVSIGACQARPGESVESLLHRVDLALYAAKDNGRNQVHQASEVRGDHGSDKSDAYG